MRNIKAIAARELKAYFNSPIAYIVIGAFLIISGYLYFSTVFLTASKCNECLLIIVERRLSRQACLSPWSDSRGGCMHHAALRCPATRMKEVFDSGA